MPASCAIDGKQDVAVQSGLAVNAVRMEDSLNAATDCNIKTPTGGVLRVFAFDE